MEQMNPYLKDMMNYVEKNVSPMPAKYDEVTVEINCESRVLEVYIDELYSNITMGISLKGGIFGVTREEFSKYIKTIIKARIDYVNNERSLINPTERFVVPSYLSCVLSNIGRVRHLDYGLELVPKLKPTKDILTKKDELLSISNKLSIVRGIGFEYAEGFTRSREGSFDFMTMTLIDGMVMNISKDPHPVFALLSSTLGVRGIESVLSPRIAYGMESHLASLVRSLATLKV